MMNSQCVLPILSLFVAMILAPYSQTQQTRSSNLQIENGVESIGPIQHPGATKPSFTLTVKAGNPDADSSEFRAGSKVRITVMMTNTTDHVIDRSGVFFHGVDASFFYDVKDEDGKQPEKLVHLHPELDTLKPFWSSVLPGEPSLTKTDLSQLYKFDRPGKYFIQVSRPDLDCLDKDGKPAVVKSNTITISITG
jgi:hypothetical protein